MAQNSAKASLYTTPDLDSLQDVVISAPINGQSLVYNSTTLKWENSTSSATGGDMTKAIYDTDNDGVVDSSETLQFIGRNSTGSTIAKTKVVYISGATGQRPNITLADASLEVSSSKTIGVTKASINNNSDGYIITHGTIHDINTSAFVEGNALYLSETAGEITNVIPSEPAHAVFVGYVAYAHPTQGKIILHIQNGYELNELHGVKITSETDKDTIYYNNSTALWENATIHEVLGYTTENVANKSTNTSLGTSNTLYPTQNAVKVYTDNLLGNANALIYKGVIDCSTNPNYPSADAGWLYVVSVAGKIGGASGVSVEVGDMLICNTDSTISGNESSVGTYWNIIQKNITGAVTGTGIANYVTRFNGIGTITTGVIQDDNYRVGINVAPSSDSMLNVLASGFEQYGLKVVNTSGGGYVYPAYGVFSKATNSIGDAYGAYLRGESSFGNTSYGAIISAVNGTNNFSLKLIDGTQGTGKFLKSVDANGSANWANITASDVSGVQGALTLTTIGYEGVASLSGNTLNVPAYKSMFFAGDFVGGDAYNAGDIVRYNNDLYICILSIGSAADPNTDPTHWSLFIASGGGGVNQNIINATNMVLMYNT
jgi:hypothetical protein